MRFLSCGVGQMRSNTIGISEIDRIYGSDFENMNSTTHYMILYYIGYIQINLELDLILLPIISLILAIYSNNAFSFITMYPPNVIYIISYRQNPYRYNLLDKRVVTLKGSRNSGVHHMQGSTLMGWSFFLGTVRALNIVYGSMLYYSNNQDKDPNNIMIVTYSSVSQSESSIYMAPPA